MTKGVPVPGRGSLEEAKDGPTPFPPGKVIFAVDVVPRVFAGRTASILTKARLFWELAGKESTIVTMYDSSQIEDIAHEFSSRGVLAPGVRLASLHEYFPDSTEFTGITVDHPVGEPGMYERLNPATGLYEYFVDGIHVMSRRFDYAGRLIVEDHFDGARNRTRSDEFWPDGTMRRQVFMDLFHGVARQEIFWRRNGSVRLNVWWRIDPVTRVRSPERVITFDEDGRPERYLSSYDEVLHACLDHLIGDEPAFICCEARRVDPWILSYHRPNVKLIFVLHNAHTRPPYDRVDSIRPIYRPLLEGDGRVAAVVFLTDAQRAEAEAHFGKNPHFHVIPHSAQEVTWDACIVREPLRVVMMARLDQQKRLPDAIRAFARVAREVPGARLEIYGRGTDELKLNRLIDSLGLTGTVVLAGYTNRPGDIYQGAGLSLCTSAYEGFGLAVLESLSNGCPVVSYDLKYGPSDIIAQGENGYLVPDGDVLALAQRVIEVLQSPDLHQRLIAAAPKAAAAFSSATLVQNWSRLYRDVSEDLRPLAPGDQPDAGDDHR